jgi:hypothetical protein
MTYREGVSAVNRIMLEAMLDYYTLQKCIAAAVQSELTAEIDGMLATIHEKMGSQSEIRVDAEFFTRYRNEVERTAMEIGVPELPAFLQSFLALKSQMGLLTGEAEGIVKTSAGSGESHMSVVAGELDSEKQALEQGADEIGLWATGAETQARVSEVVQNETEISAGEAELLYRYATEMDGALSIVGHIVSIEKHYSLGNGSALTALVTAETGNRVSKYLAVADEIQMFCAGAGALCYFVSAGTGAEMLTGLTVGMKRYRRLEELDGLSLEELDEKTLEELDFVVLA